MGHQPGQNFFVKQRQNLWQLPGRIRGLLHSSGHTASASALLENNDEVGDAACVGKDAANREIYY